jgi:hypothetical protein
MQKVVSEGVRLATSRVTAVQGQDAISQASIAKVSVGTSVAAMHVHAIGQTARRRKKTIRMSTFHPRVGMPKDNDFSPRHRADA